MMRCKDIQNWAIESSRRNILNGSRRLVRKQPLRIKFDGSHDATKRDDVSFIRKSTSQMERDRRRTVQWNAKKQHPAPSRQSPASINTESNVMFASDCMMTRSIRVRITLLI